ncbi:hypothetical protein [Streptomyces lasiicapitis]|uniref:hypothetical protein n=1 Tax=Streptomyces lasiicapitis TaxID=1923961 RepID=UPI0036B57AC6
MATTDLSGALSRTDGAVDTSADPAPLPESVPASTSLFAAARSYEQQARDLSVRHSVLAFTSGFDAGSTDRLAEVRAQRDGHLRLAAAYRAASRRRARFERLGRLVRKAVGR